MNVEASERTLANPEAFQMGDLGRGLDGAA
jgi:hypothetical protein